RGRGGGGGRDGGGAAVGAGRAHRRTTDRGADQRRLRLAPGRADRLAGGAEQLRGRRTDGECGQRVRGGGGRRPDRPPRRPADGPVSLLRGREAATVRVVR